MYDRSNMRYLRFLVVFVLALAFMTPAASAGVRKHGKHPNYKYKAPKYQYKKPKIKGAKHRH